MFEVEEAIRLTDGYGTIECQRFRERIFRSHEFLALALAKYYREVANNHTYVVANDELRKLHNSLKLSRTFYGLYIDSPHDDVKAFAQQRAKEMANQYRAIVKRYGHSRALAYLIEKLDDCKFNFPVKDLEAATDNEIAIAIAKVLDADWWRRQIRKRQDIVLESLHIKLGHTHLNAGIYISDNGFRRKYYQWQRNEKILAGLDVVNDLGEVFNLLEIVKTSVSNLVNRRNELMTRIAGTEDYAKAQNHCAVFYTLTAPSKYHRWLKKPCKANPKYQHFTPKDGQDYLNGVWSRVRAKLDRDNILYYGVRVVEPHHDGTPHWHLLLFVQPNQRKAIERTFRHYALQEAPNERGARERRFKAENIDPNKGSAVGYIAKYVAKNIDGADVGEDLYGRDAIESATRIRAWASNWGIRQFQFIGCPSVTTWRELRRAAREDLAKATIDKLSDKKLDALLAAADTGNWCEFMTLSGGAKTKLKHQPIRAMHIMKEKLNKYGEEAKKILGLIYQNANKIVTRFKQWYIIEKPAIPAGNITALCFDSGGANAPPLEFCQ